MHFTLKLFTLDPSLGRLDYASLSDQARMELMVERMPDREFFQDDNGAYKDVCDWRGVSCDFDGNVQDIWISIYDRSKGSIDLSYIPPHVTTMSLTWGVTGLQTQASIDVQMLPERLAQCIIQLQQMVGTVDMTALPATLTNFIISGNKCTGSFVLTSLPPGIENIHARGNLLLGSLNFSSLPDKLVEIQLDKNRFSGEFRIEKFPRALNRLTVSQNRLIGEAVIQKGKKFWDIMFSIDENFISSVVDPAGKKHSWQARILKTQRPMSEMHAGKDE